MSKKSIFILILLIYAGTFLRLFKFTNTLLLQSDQAMAFLLAERIINHGHILLVGPNTSFHNVNLLSPIYYYLLTLFYFFWRSELAVSLVFAFFGIISIPLIYFLAKELNLSSKAALLTAFFQTFSFTLIKYSRNIWEPHLVPFLVMLALFLALKAERKSQFLLLLLSVFLFFVSLMYISSFLILPAFFLLAYSILKKIDPAAKHPFLKNLIIFLLFFALFYLPNIFFEITNGFPSLSAINNIPLTGNGNYPKNTISQFSSFITSLFPLYNFLLFPVIRISLSVGFILLVEPIRKIKWLTYALISAVFLIGLYPGETHPHRLATLYPLFLLIMSAAISRLNSVLITVSITLLFFLINMNIYQFYISRNLQSDIKFNLAIAKFILNDANGQSLSIYTYSPYNSTNYNTVYYVYLMEKVSKKNLYPLHFYGNWIDSQVNKNAYWIYLICENYSQLNQKIKCLDNFENENSLGDPVKSFSFSERRIVYKFKGINK